MTKLGCSALNEKHDVNEHGLINL